MNRAVYLVRHGLTLSNQKKVYAGQSEEPLTEKGAGQAHALAKQIAEWHIERIYASPVRRAVQTAEILNGHIGKELVVRTGLAEMKMGDWEGLSESEIARRYPKEFQIWQLQPSKLELPGRETLKEIQVRAVDAVEEILKETSDRIILVVTHVAVIRCLIMYFHKLSLDMYKRIDVPNLCIHKLLFRGKEVAAERIQFAEKDSPNCPVAASTFLSSRANAPPKSLGSLAT